MPRFQSSNTITKKAQGDNVAKEQNFKLYVFVPDERNLLTFGLCYSTFVIYMHVKNYHTPRSPYQ